MQARGSGGDVPVSLEYYQLEGGASSLKERVREIKLIKCTERAEKNCKNAQCPKT